MEAMGKFVDKTKQQVKQAVGLSAQAVAVVEAKDEIEEKKEPDEDKDFYESMPGYKSQLTRKKETKFAEKDTDAKKEADIRAEYRKYEFDKELIEEREKQRGSIDKRKRKEETRHRLKMFALKKEREMLDELEDPDNNLWLIWYGSTLTRNLVDRKTVRAENKAKRDAARHKKNLASVGKISYEEPQAPRFRAKHSSHPPLLQAPAQAEEPASLKRLARGAKRQRCEYVDDEAEEVSPEEAEAEDAAVLVEGEESDEASDESA